MRKTWSALAAAALVAGGLAFSSAQSAGFRFDGAISRVITPNNDGRNDLGILCFDNFSDSGVDGKIYSLRGAEVASLQKTDAPLPGGCPPGNKEQHMAWNPRTQGNARSGIYVYQLKVEGMAFAGTFVVVR